jgi:carbamoyl-phosphate synthase large subunit
MKLKILITGGGGAATEALYNIWEKKYILYFCDCNPLKKPKFISKKKWVEVPVAYSKNYLVKLNRIVSILKIDLLIPTVDEEVQIISNNRHKIKCDLFIPSKKFVDIHKNKWKTNQFLKKEKFNFPETKILKKNIKLLPGPIIIKPISGRGSKGVRIINQKKGIKNFISRSDLGGDMIIQKKIKGQEYTVMICANKNGVVRAIVPVRVIEKRGITTLGKTEYNKDIINACYEIHNKFKTLGCYNIQLILDKRNKVYPFEINPRISTTTCLAVYAGIDIINIFLKDNTKEKNKINLKKFKNNILLSRNWTNYFSKIK